MKRKQGKLIFQNQSDGSFRVILFRKTDNGQSVLKGFQNADNWQHLNNQDCEYDKYGKQIKVYIEELGEKPLYDSTKPANTPVYSRRTVETEQVNSRSNKNKTTDSLSAEVPSHTKEIRDSFDIRKAKVPEEIRKLRVSAREIDNFSLKLNKYARWEENTRKPDNSKFMFFKKGRNGTEFEIKTNYGNINFEGIANKIKKGTSTVCGNNIEIIESSTVGRFITGLGGASVYDTGITLHHIYGYPYIPATSLKGIIRSWIIQSYFGADKQVPENEKRYPFLNAEYRAYQNDTFCRIFGCPSRIDKVVFDNKNEPMKKPDGTNKTNKMEVAIKEEHQGNVLFFDAMPLSAPQIKTDIINVHYQKYYSKGNAPVDHDQPNPIPFLTVENTKFQFIIGSKNKEWLGDWTIGDKNIVDWLKDALQNYGIGAKTAVGYGYFDKFIQISKVVDTF